MVARALVHRYRWLYEVGLVPVVAIACLFLSAWLTLRIVGDWIGIFSPSSFSSTYATLSLDTARERAGSPGMSELQELNAIRAFFDDWVTETIQRSSACIALLGLVITIGALSLDWVFGRLANRTVRDTRVVDGVPLTVSEYKLTTAGWMVLVHGDTYPPRWMDIRVLDPTKCLSWSAWESLDRSRRWCIPALVGLPVLGTVLMPAFMLAVWGLLSGVAGDGITLAEELAKAAHLNVSSVRAVEDAAKRDARADVLAYFAGVVALAVASAQAYWRIRNRSARLGSATLNGRQLVHVHRIRPLVAPHGGLVWDCLVSTVDGALLAPSVRTWVDAFALTPVSEPKPPEVT